MKPAWMGIVGFAIAMAPAPATAAFLHEYPHPATVVSFHPRGDRPFRLQDLRHALDLGVSAAELDLRWRAGDSSVVCAHRLRDVAQAATLEDAFRTISAFQGERLTVRGDGRQFFLILDLKDERSEFHAAMVRILAAQARRFANSGARTDQPRGMTVVVSGFRAALEHAIPAAALDTLCLVEGRNYGPRMTIPEGAPRFQWITVEYPIDRERVRALHEGRDGRARGRFNVRVIAAGSHVARAVATGADAVNADLEMIERAVAAARGEGRR